MITTLHIKPTNVIEVHFENEKHSLYVAERKVNALKNSLGQFARKYNYIDIEKIDNTVCYVFKKEV